MMPPTHPNLLRPLEQKAEFFSREFQRVSSRLCFFKKIKAINCLTGVSD